VLPVTTEILYALPLDDPFASIKYERCAVVGNSGILRLYRLGEHIDQHDMVIRFNLAPTEGYSDIVGRKTTFRLVNSQHVGFHEANESVIQQMQSEVGVQLFLKARADHPERKCVVFSLSPNPSPPNSWRRGQCRGVFWPGITVPARGRTTRCPIYRCYGIEIACEVSTVSASQHLQMGCKSSHPSRER
jgi:hypothetical protein